MPDIPHATDSRSDRSTGSVGSDNRPEPQSPSSASGAALKGDVRASRTRYMDDEEWDAKMREPKTCTKCGETFPTGDFPSTTSRGKIHIRSWCAVCLATYYREHRQQKTSTNA